MAVAVREWGLNRFDWLPQKPTQSTLVAQKAWSQVRGIGVPRVEPANPYRFVFYVFTRDAAYEATLSESIAYVIASEYALQQPRTSGVCWQFS